MTDPAEPAEISEGTESADSSTLERRRRPSTFGGLIYLVVVLTTAVGLGLVAFGPWRRGIALIGVVFLFAAGVRLLINEEESGMLRVRGRWFDTVALAGAGIALIALAANIPDQPGL